MQNAANTIHPETLPNPKFVFSKRAIKALLAIASKDTGRAHLCGVGVVGSTLYATDGHRAVRVEHPDMGPVHVATTDGRVLIPSDFLARVAKMAHARDSIEIVIDYDDRTVAATVGSHTISEDLPDTYGQPEYARVFPDVSQYEGNGCMGINPAYLADLAKLAKAVDGAPEWLMHTPTDTLSPIAFASPNVAGPRWTYIVMPTRLP